VRVIKSKMGHELFQKYVKEGSIDSTVEKPNKLCQTVRDEFELPTSPESNIEKKNNCPYLD